jgi:hypothetical protein
MTNAEAAQLQPGTMKTREHLSAERQRIIGEIEQIFIDAEYWNTHVRKPDEAPIDPDPDGQMTAILKALKSAQEYDLLRPDNQLTVVDPDLISLKHDELQRMVVHGTPESKRSAKNELARRRQ